MELEMLRSEKQMAKAVERFLGNSVLEIKVGGCLFDVVAYDRQKKLFKVVECKLATHASSIGKTFGQVVGYCAVVTHRGFDFLNAFNKKRPLPLGDLAEIVRAKRAYVEFYVALTEEACKQAVLLRNIKRLLEKVGILRVKGDGSVRANIKYDRKRDAELGMARALRVRIVQPGPADRTTN